MLAAMSSTRFCSTTLDRNVDCARIILSDTVGFISDLPTMLIAAFRATLEEVVEAPTTRSLASCD